MVEASYMLRTEFRRDDWRGSRAVARYRIVGLDAPSERPQMPSRCDVQQKSEKSESQGFGKQLQIEA